MWGFRQIRKKGESHETEYMSTQYNKFVYGQLFFYSVCLQSSVFSQSSVSAKAMVKSGVQNLYFGWLSVNLFELHVFTLSV